MKSFFLFNFLILFIIFSNINNISNNPLETTKQIDLNKSKKKTKKNSHNYKKQKIFKYFFLSKINTKIVDINEELSPDFNNFKSINYKNTKILFTKEKYELKDNPYFNKLKEGYNIKSKISNNYLIKENYRKNDFLIKYLNTKSSQENENEINIPTQNNNQNQNTQIVNKDSIKNNFHKNHYNQYIPQNHFNIHNPMNNRFHNNYIPNERNIIYNDYSNYQYNTLDDEFDNGNQDFNHRRNIHGDDFNMRYNSHSSNSFHKHHPTFTNTQPHKSKFSEYMNSIYQIMMVFFFIGLVYKLFFGNKQNDKHALEWYEANKDYFKERYEIFGLVEDEENGSFKKDENMKDNIMIKENPNNYKLICGNYRYIKYIAISLQFHKRYDMSLMVASMFIPLKDKIVYQVTFNSVDPCGWVFCISRKNQCNIIKDNYEDLNLFCEVYQPKFMDENMCLISEDYDIFDELFKIKNLLQYYKNIEPFIETIYYSDFINLLTEENNIYFSFDIDLSNSFQKRIYLEITHFVNLFVDGLAQIKYTKEFKEKVNNNRLLYKENKINDSRKKEIEEKEKKNFIEKWKIKNKMKGKSGFERKKLERKLKKYH